jgi:hypothetical protein
MVPGYGAAGEEDPLTMTPVSIRPPGRPQTAQLQPDDHQSSINRSTQNPLSPATPPNHTTPLDRPHQASIPTNAPRHKRPQNLKAQTVAT